MLCVYCDGDRDDYVSMLPKENKGFNAHIWKGITPRLVVTGEGKKGIFKINFCPMCGKKL